MLPFAIPVCRSFHSFCRIGSLVDPKTRIYWIIQVIVVLRLLCYANSWHFYKIAISILRCSCEDTLHWGVNWSTASHQCFGYFSGILLQSSQYLSVSTPRNGRRLEAWLNLLPLTYTLNGYGTCNSVIEINFRKREIWLFIPFLINRID